MATSAEKDIELGDHLVVDETAKKDLTGDSENIQLTETTGSQNLPGPVTDDELIGEEALVRHIHGIDKQVKESRASEIHKETPQNGSTTSTQEFNVDIENQRQASSVINNAVSGYGNGRRCLIPTHSVHGGPLSIVPLDVTNKSEEDVLEEFGHSKESTLHNICTILWTYLNVTVTLYIHGQAQPVICSGALTDPQTWKRFLNNIHLSNKVHSCKPASSTLLLKLYKKFLTNANQIQTVSCMSAELTFRSPEGPVTVTCLGRVKEFYDKPDAVFLLSPPIPTAVCEQLHTIYVKLGNVVRGMSKEPMSMRSLFIFSLRDTGEKEVFPLERPLMPEDSRLEETAVQYLMRVFEEKKERKEENSEKITRISQGREHAFIIQAELVLSQFEFSCRRLAE
ncbi:uncharacterized protein LOC106053649 [Biomphalaria glabrata]|uniref:Uncharacterized protein LOC106053649 n=1 Tax=Biomphalaria glabrata TaxID=6526 RepID=A0A9W3AL94_BIOGL|nr:uncharacterized protein LOC106053649 [Biomphalaria glabrata]XP_055887900.1 uncharacterized protein LOC106053649 [Biomphalaria glabrata]XP_055887901.1 uncharacterized protein LOC106053649 [Biomphalaria glabrata]XP_055887902.1 uncharacterized protein LOC106053649 [Biomphalaria glabrata]XP_055887903.1 uncharacterized protein LOC106053649 [Biomphalaria glabrata]